jgi:N-acetylglutamate synthase-like GNAT family acetyltransferase
VDEIQMPVIRKAYTEDFDSIYPLLEQFNNKDFDKEHWSRLFTRYWPNSEDHIGFVMLDDEHPVGFIGTIYSERTKERVNEKVCNISSWIVEPKYRNESLLLFNQILAQKNNVITTFTPIPESVKILSRFGFKMLDNALIWLPRQHFYRHKRLECFSGDEILKHNIDNEIARIYSDHRQFNAQHFLFKKNDAQCYVMVKRVNIFRRKLIKSRFINICNTLCRKMLRYSFLDKEINVAQTHYISDVMFFNENILNISGKISVLADSSGLIVDKRFYKKNKWLLHFESNPQISLFRPVKFTAGQIDSAYSEMFVLDF